MSLVILVFVLVYVGMVLGKLPGLALDRTGVALLGAIAMVSGGALPISDAWAAVDMPTIYLLFALMVISAQFRLAGFYSELVRRVVRWQTQPPTLLALVLAVSGGLSAVLTNDVVCLAVTPVLVEGCVRRSLNPIPFLLGLACASNVGSAATLIGNPQNILIGQTLGLSFGRFLLDAGAPAVLGLGAIWGVIAWQYRGKWTKVGIPPDIHAPPFNRWQSFKAVGVSFVLIALFLFRGSLPRDGVALTCAGVLLLSRRMASREMLALVDWQLLVLFVGLFIVNRAFVGTGSMESVLVTMRGVGVDPSDPHWLFVLSVTLSNLVSNVPATMLLLPAATHPWAGPILALSSTLAGNLFIVGSIANMIVVAGAKSFGVEVDFRTHVRTGLPVTLVTLLIAALWLVLRVRAG
ncbi:MAG: anion transporter [Deltaproteobacteria bacterium]|nr:anion transporter [Deltaproteobacteria bacterium]